MCKIIVSLQYTSGCDLFGCTLLLIREFGVPVCFCEKAQATRHKAQGRIEEEEGMNC